MPDPTRERPLAESLRTVGLLAYALSYLAWPFTGLIAVATGLLGLLVVSAGTIIPILADLQAGPDPQREPRRTCANFFVVLITVIGLVAAVVLYGLNQVAQENAAAAARLR